MSKAKDKIKKNIQWTGLTGGSAGMAKLVGRAGDKAKGDSAPDEVDMPTIADPTVMPTQDDEAMRKKKKLALLAQQKRGGRASTFLSTEDKLG